MTNLSEFMHRLKGATGSDFAAIAKAIEEPKQFVYDLRDGRARHAYRDGQRVPAHEDARYLRLGRFCAKFGIPEAEFFEVVRAAQAGSDPGGEVLLVRWGERAIASCAAPDTRHPHLRPALRGIDEGFGSETRAAANDDGSDAPDPEGSAELLRILLDTCPPELDGVEKRRRVIRVLDAYARQFRRNG